MTLKSIKYFMLCFIVPILLATVSADEKKTAISDKPYDQQVFEQILSEYEDMTFEQFKSRISKREHKDGLTFDPQSIKFYDSVSEKMKLNPKENEIFKRNGFVSVDQGQRYSFASAYYAIYTRDLPVFITTDSVLHAMHRSYDEILKELEETFFTHTIDVILSRLHSEIYMESVRYSYTYTLYSKHFKDVDLYLTIALNLLNGAGAKIVEKEKENILSRFESRESDIDYFEQELKQLDKFLGTRVEDEWDGKLIVHSKFDQDDKVLEILNLVTSLAGNFRTSIYGDERNIDYSQFKPRGHYTKSIKLQRYFRCMMWLGRADCGWNIIPNKTVDRLQADRELRNSILLTEALIDTKSMDQLKAINDIIKFMVGKSDNLSPFTMFEVLKENNLKKLSDVEKDEALGTVRSAIESDKFANQTIRSQLVMSDTLHMDKVVPPLLFQMFGQRFVIDSFLLSQVVFDSILFKKKKIERFMPKGLDVMAALGNNEAVFLLSDELEKWNYSANLLACMELVNRQLPGFWKQSLYNLWLNCLRTIDDDMARQKNFPQVMAGKAWQMKQLQTQLSSWAELRHDTILYAKHAYTAGAVCEYPTGYIEPYPAFYSGVKYFADESARLFKAADYSSYDRKQTELLKEIQKRQILFFENMSVLLGQLKELAEKELEGEPFTEEEKQFIKKTIDMRGGGSGAPRYDGWYCNLFYNRNKQGGLLANKWDPTIADVHTDPNERKVLEVGVGDVNFCVIAIDNEDDKSVYVGPIYSYYEFHERVNNRLTDEEWQLKIRNGNLPSRPEWTQTFQGPARKRYLE